MKVLNDTELKALLTKLKSKFALANHTHAGYANSTHSHSVVSTTAAGFAPIRGNTTTKFLRDDGTWAVPPDTKVTVDKDFDDSSNNPVANYVIDAALNKKANKTLATTSAMGLMSAADKKIIDYFRIDSRNNVTTNPTYGNLMVVPGTNDDYNTELASWVLNGENCSVLHYEDKKTASNSTNFIVYHPKTKRVQFPTGVEISNLYSAGELYIRSNATDIWIDFGYDDYNFNTASATFSHPLHVEGKVTSSGSDYAKYYEWLDENPDNEDRRGLFVTLEGEKIKTANAEDGFILGVVSAAPGFVENAYEKEWQGKYMKDIYGERITQETEVPESTDAEGNTIPATIKTEYVLNPEYNEDEKYIPRSQRSEWTYVGLTGELVVRDDGTCKVDGYCKPSEGGIATKSERGYRVLARLDDTHIKVLIK